MNPAALVPNPEAIPGPWWVFSGLGWLTFTLHILSVNVLAGGLLFALLGRFGSPDGRLRQLVRPFEGHLPTLFAISINLGVAPLLFLQVVYGHLFYSSSVLMGVAWLAIIPMLIVGYYSAYIFAKSRESHPGRAIAALVVSLMVMATVAYLFGTNLTLTQTPEAFTAYFSDHGGRRLAFGEPTAIPRYLHFVVASIAITALVGAVFAKKGGREDMVKVGLRFYGFATMAQVVVGVWFLFAQPDAVRSAFLGGSALSTGVLGAGALTGIGSISTAMRGKLGPTIGLLLATVGLMTMLRGLARATLLHGIADVEALPQTSQPLMTVVFFAVFLAGLALVGWMTKKSFATGRA